MINLLANERKDEIRAAQVNVILTRYMAIVSLAFVFIGGALFVSFTVLNSTMTSANERVTNNDLQAGVYKETKQQVESLSTKLGQAKTMLAQEVQYSKVLVELGQRMPAGTILGDIVLTTENFNGQPLEVKAYAKSTIEVGLLQTSLQGSPYISKVDIKNTDTNQEVASYPVTVSISLILKRAGL